MTHITHFSRRKYTVRGFIFALIIALWVCTGNLSTAQVPSKPSAAGSIPDVTIIREQVINHPQKYIEFTRNIISKCLEIKAGYGRPERYDQELTNEYILQLKFERTEERFSAGRYVEDKQFSSLQGDKWGHEVGQSCIPKSKHFRRLKIIPNRCKQIDIVYDLDNGTGTLEESNLCDPSKGNGKPFATGEIEQLGSGHSCRWVIPKGQFWSRSCLLEPWQRDDHDRAMEVKSETDEQMLISLTPAAKNSSITMLALLASIFHEKNVTLDVGTTIAQSFFEAPANSRNFPKKVIGK